MAILSDYEEEGQKKPMSSETSVRKPFKDSLDLSDPLGFLERVFEFLARESDLLKSETLEEDLNTVVRVVREKVEARGRKRKATKIEENVEAEKKVKEDPPEASKAAEESEEEKGSETKEKEENTGPRASNADQP